MSGQTLIGRAGRCGIALLAAAAFWLLQSPASVRADEESAKAGSATAAADRPSAPTGTITSSPERIQKLIQELGSPRYPARRAAANELRQIGSEAFDLLHAATDSSDPEIAASANYLLRQIAVRWIHAEDSAAVRLQLRQYGQEPEAARLQRVDALARLPRGAGVAGLCRIARFDRSPLVSRTAALAIIRPKKASRPRPEIDVTVVEQELGGSTRPPAAWLRECLVQLRDPSASVAAWKKLIDDETVRLDKNAAETSNEIVLGLLWNLADNYRQIGDQAALAGVVDQMLETGTDGADETIVNLLIWLSDNKSWDVLDAFLAKNQPRIAQSKRPLYYAALARSKQGKRDLAEELAAAAADVAQSQTPLEGFAIAKDLEEHSQFEWAVREYRRAIDHQTVNTPESILARISLSSLLHDYEREKDAADTLEPFVKAVQGDSKVGQLYAKIREYYASRSLLPEPDSIAARYHFYRACQYQAEKDLTRARKSLEDAIQFDPTDADVLINMYHFPESDAKWLDSVRQRIRRLTQQFQQQIDEDLADASPYNQWAWLVSNTEGDFQKAIRYSHRSLELNANGESGAASYLDTLGRCYFAAGDYANAVKYEREAVEKVDYLQVMRRQLAQFEKTLAEKGPGTPAQSPQKSK